MLIMISILLAGILILVGVLQFWSYPGKSKPFVDKNGSPLSGSISEKIFLNINGVKQGMFIKSKDVTNPVLLYLRIYSHLQRESRKAGQILNNLERSHPR